LRHGTSSPSYQITPSRSAIDIVACSSHSIGTAFGRPP
jgi:hypothetical protein